MLSSCRSSLPILVITGPTASGKSIFAAEIAHRFNGEVINGDSMQIYDALPILTNQPSTQLKQAIVHHLFAVVSPLAAPSNVQQWLLQAGDCIEAIHAKEKLAIVCGGSGLYIHALLHGLSPIPDIPKEIRNSVRLRLIHEGPQVLHHILSTCDPVMAQIIKPCDSSRTARALEVWQATGKSLAVWQQEAPLKVAETQNIHTILIAPDAQIRRHRIETRSSKMLKEGVIEEVQQTDISAWHRESPLRKAIGLRAIGHYLENKISLEEALNKLSTQTKQYGKRQMTWFRHHLSPKVTLCDDTSPFERQQIARLMQDILPSANF